MFSEKARAWNCGCNLALVALVCVTVAAGGVAVRTDWHGAGQFLARHPEVAFLAIVLAEALFVLWVIYLVIRFLVSGIHYFERRR